MRKISAAKSVASSPPVPARISSTMFFSSLGSLGTSRILSSSPTLARRSSSRVSSSWAYSRNSASDSSAIIALLSSIPRCRSLYSRYFSTISESSLCAFAVFWYFDESLITSGDARARVSSSYRDSIWFRRSNIRVLIVARARRIGSSGDRVIGPSEDCQNCQRLPKIARGELGSLLFWQFRRFWQYLSRGPHLARFYRLLQKGHIGFRPCPD